MSKSEASKTFRVPRTTLRNKIEGKSPTESIGHGGVSSMLGSDTEKIKIISRLDSYMCQNGISNKWRWSFKFCEKNS